MCKDKVEWSKVTNGDGEMYEKCIFSPVPICHPRVSHVLNFPKMGKYNVFE